MDISQTTEAQSSDLLYQYGCWNMTKEKVNIFQYILNYIRDDEMFNVNVFKATVALRKGG